MMMRKYGLEIIAALLILLFMYTSISKLLDYEKFSVELSKSPITSDFSSVIAWSVPGIEIIISVLLSIHRLRLFGLYLSFFLMIMFTGYIIMMINFTDHLPCTCGGVLESMSWDQHLIFNICFTLLAGVGIILSKPNTKETFIAIKTGETENLK